MTDLAGKVALVTGGSGGIGRAAALLFASRGAAVVVASRSVEECERPVDMIEARAGIRINVVCPGAIETDMLKGLTGGNQEFERAVAASEPMGRVGRPKEVAEAVVWLYSGAASFVTGHALAVDGGWTAQ